MKPCYSKGILCVYASSSGSLKYYMEDDLDV